MKISDLKSVLESKNVPPLMYSLDGIKQGECLCLESENGVWRVFYNSRGKITFSNEFLTEDDACNKFYEIMKNDYGWG
jgi:hypothetical protein